MSTLALRRLARYHGVLTAYTAADGRRRMADEGALLAVLRSLGVPLTGLADVPDALRSAAQAHWRQVVPPVAVAGAGRPAAVPLRLPLAAAAGPLRCRLEAEAGLVAEAGLERTWTVDPHRLASAGPGGVAEGIAYGHWHLSLPPDLPLGYHRLIVTFRGLDHRCLVIAAPARLTGPASAPSGHRPWGVFAPLYALHSHRSWGAGDLTDLDTLAEWVHGLGGNIIATLPLLAAFLDQPFDPSPYAPVSRLFWNEFYLDITDLPHLAQCPAARTLLADPILAAARADLQAGPLVDYRRGMALRRRVVATLARWFFAGAGPEQDGDLQSFLAERPAAPQYARFRAVMERRQVPWHRWSERLRSGHLDAGDYDEADYHYHLYAQWQAQRQMDRLAARLAQRGQGLYLDLPLGVHPDGYDTWREPGIFAADAAGGAPPDPFFAAGQDWGFPPLHPQRLREQGYGYFIAGLRHQLRHARMLRIDHVMGLHRLFWVPRGFTARDGVYVRYHADELYAILTLEAHRAGAAVVGEDLGTVPAYVRRTMAQRGVHRMSVLQFEVAPTSAQALPQPDPDQVATLNTHDMPSFAAFWHGYDVADRVRLGLLNVAEALAETEGRRAVRRAMVQFLQARGLLTAAPGADGDDLCQPDGDDLYQPDGDDLYQPDGDDPYLPDGDDPYQPDGDDPYQPDGDNPHGPDVAEVLQACLLHLGGSDAALAVVNLEDLWLETQPQNRPGTGPEQPNWQRRSALGLNEIATDPRVAQLLRGLDGARRQRLS